MQGPIVTTVVMLFLKYYNPNEGIHRSNDVLLVFFDLLTSVKCIEWSKVTEDKGKHFDWSYITFSTNFFYQLVTHITDSIQLFYF